MCALPCAERQAHLRRTEVTLFRALRAQCHARRRALTAIVSVAVTTRSEAWHVCVQAAARRKVVELAYFGGLSTVQIGRAFGVPSAA